MSDLKEGSPPQTDRRNNSSPFAGGRAQALGESAAVELLFGKVVYTSPLTGTALCSVDGHPVPLCCEVASDVHSPWGGVSSRNCPSPGTRVIIARSHAHDYGAIMGCLPPIVKSSEDGHNHSLMPEARRRTSLSEPHNFKDTHLDKVNIEFGQFRPEDAYPGDRTWMGPMGSAIGINESSVVVRGSELAGFEAFALYDKARIYGHRLERFSGDGEARNYADLGVTMSEEYLAPNERTSFGNGGMGWSFPEESVVDEANLLTGGWGYRKFAGTLPFGVSQITTIQKVYEDRFRLGLAMKDIGVSSSVRDFAGSVLEKGIGTMGFVKSTTHPVPYKLYEHDDPRGDQDREFIEYNCDGAYKLDDKLDPSMYFRDMMAWETDRMAGSRWRQRKKDWSLPDSADAPSITDFGAIRDAHSSAGGSWYRNPSTSGQMKDGQEMMHDRKCWANDAWVVVLPNGAVSIRDAWGASISMFRGSIEISASNDIVMHAGRHIIARAGGDAVVHGRNNVDVIAQEQQLRLWAKSDAYLSSQKGGIMLSTETGGNNQIQSVGEKNHVRGIVMKATDSPVTVMAESQVFGANSHFLFTGNTADEHPPMFIRSSSILMDTTSGLQVRQGGTGEPAGYTTVGNGIWTTAQGTFEKGVWAITGGVSLATQINEAACVSDRWKSLGDILPPAFNGRSVPGVSQGIIAASKSEASQVYHITRDQKLLPNPSGEGNPPDPKIDWDSPSLLNGYERKDLDNAWFWFRSESSYLTSYDFEWHEKPWEREWTGRSDWGEVPRTEHGSGKTAPFPGDTLWDSPCLIKTTEKNVKVDGTAVKADTMVSSPSTSKLPLTKLGRHGRS